MKTSEPRIAGRDEFPIVGVTVPLIGLGAIATAWARPSALPVVALAALSLTIRPLAIGWKATRGLALRPALAWAGVAVGLALAGQVAAFSEPVDAGRPWAGHWAYLSSLATLAALISVFGARRPGGGAWAILMGLLVLVFLIPWLEGSGLRLARDGMDRLRLDAPWSIFFALLALAGITNYVPTRFGTAALFVGAALATEFAGLIATGWPPSRRAAAWSVGPIFLSLGVVRAWGRATSREPAPPGLASLWLWFRDGWGVVWALRVRERFHRAAEASRWPVRLAWQGVEAADPAAIPAAAEATFAGLIRRFASEDRVASAADPCPPPPLPGESDFREPRPERRRLSVDRKDSKATALIVLAVLGSMAAIHLLKVILVPLVLALLLACILSPLTRLLRRALPLGATGAAVVLFLLLTMLGLYGSTLAAESLVKAMVTLPDDADKLSRLLSTRVADLTRDTPLLAGVLPEPGTIDLLGDRNRTFLIAMLSDRLGDLSGVVAQGLMVLVLALFFLIESEMLAPKLVRFFAPAPGDAHAAERALQDLVHQLRAYLVARTLINVGLGLAFAAALWMLGVRYALAQGGMVAVTNYVPYVGQVAGGAVAVLATLIQGKEFGDALIVAAVYLGLLGVEGYVVTPWVLGKSLDLNGTTVLIACLFWGFLWGLVGLVLAMPLAVCMKLTFQHVPGLHRWADLMSYTWVPPAPQPTPDDSEEPTLFDVGPKAPRDLPAKPSTVRDD